MIKKTSLFLLIISGFLLSNAQQQGKFSPDSASFMGAIRKYMSDVPSRNKTEVKSMLSFLSSEWNYGRYDSHNRKQMVGTLNLMDSLGLSQHTDFYYFLNTYTHFLRDGQEQQAVDSLNAFVVYSLKHEGKRSRTELLRKLNNAVSKKIIADDAGVRWICRGGKYIFNTDSIAAFIFSDCDLVCHAHRDSIRIQKTRGVYYPGLGLWQGSSGKVYWEKAGFDPDKIYVRLNKYKIELRYDSYTADSVIYYDTMNFRQILYGSFEDKIDPGISGRRRINYPVFISYLDRIQINNLFNNIVYDGGYTLEGNRIVGSGSRQRDAQIRFYKNRKERITLRSKRFIISNDRIVSDHASASIYYDNDSIYHPDLNIKYLDDSKLLTLQRGSEGLSISPFYNSFHEMEMYFESLNWTLGKQEMTFETALGMSRKGRAFFISNNFYSRSLFDRIKGIDELNPLIAISSYCYKYATDIFYDYELAEHIRKSKSQVMAVLIDLASKGFLEIDTKSGLVKVKQKLNDYILARNNKTDYDVISIRSDVDDGLHARLDIDSFDLSVYGVSQVFLSDSQQVYIYPRKSEITLKSDRDFVFSGRIHAGLLDFYARDCSFEYDTFRLNMPFIDSLTFMVRSKEEGLANKDKYVKLNTVIRDLSGTIWIDQPENKSSLKSFPRYPIFESSEDAYVYYNKNNIKKGVYDKESFYYTVYPFTFDSLNTFTTDALSFEGMLSSGGILPDIEEPLVVRDDYSFGFNKNSPEDGYVIYGGKGRFISDIDLSNKGLKGKGTIKYLNATTVSDEFVFFPDSVKALTESIQIKGRKHGVEYPEVNANQTEMLWLTNTDSMLFANLPDTLFQLYNEQASIDGLLVMTPQGLKGSGKLLTMDAVFRSNAYWLKNQNFSSDTTSFRINNITGDKLVFSTEVYSSFVDFKTKIGRFRTNGQGSRVQFPVNQYETFMDEFDWYMDENKVRLRNNLAGSAGELEKLSLRELMDIDLKGSEFLSVHPGQDSLRFFALNAEYSLEDNIIQAADVKFIHVADAAVFPLDGKVTIGPEAVMGKLSKASMIIDTSNKYHYIYDADVKIKSGKEYQASGTYDYSDLNGDIQQVYFSSIKTDTAATSIATATVDVAKPLALSPYFHFAGKIHLKASREKLFFDGGFNIFHDCGQQESDWVSFESELDPLNILIPLEDTIYNLQRKRVAKDILLSLGQRVYSAVFVPKTRYSDSPILKAKGLIRFNQEKNIYEIANKERLDDPEHNSNYLAFDNNKCIMYGDGKLETGIDYGEVLLETYGSIENFIIPDSTSINASLILDFFFSEDLLERLSEKFQEANLNGISLELPAYQKAVRSVAGPEESVKLAEEVKLFGQYKKIPEQLEKSFVFADINLVWNKLTRSYLSYGPIGIANIGSEQINKYTEGIIELDKRRGGDVLNIYLKLSEKDWYFFSFSNHIMQSLSSDNEYNNKLQAIKEDKRILKLEDTEISYQYIISTRRKMVDFLRKIQSVKGTNE